MNASSAQNQLKQMTTES